MINRRTTLKIGAAGALAGLVNLPLQVLAYATNITSSRPFQAIYDSSYSESITFANTIQAIVSPGMDIKGDISKLWYGQLRNQLITSHTPLIGLTSRRDLFCLEELARDVGMKVNFRVDHLIAQDGKVEHQINGSPVTNSSLGKLGYKSGFGNKMAELSELFLNDLSADLSAQKLTGPYAPANKTALVTWVIS